jgi:predicted small secreted protein
MMKRNTLISIFVITLIASLVTACGADNDCKSCSKVSYQDGHEISRTPGVPYCGDELAEKENTPPVTILGVTTVWECN